jgi:type II secretory pathway pseudopilin PulG
MLRLHDSSKSRRRTSRAGFTLVELLVSIGIFIILATLALSAFRDSKHDKVAAGARQIYASIGGARSRASKTNEPRGVRLLQDKQDYTLITNIQYVGQSQLYDGTLRVQINSSGVVQLRTTATDEWEDLRNEGLLKPGSQIYIRTSNPQATTTPSAANSTGGRWYTIASPGFDPDNDRIRIVGLIDGAQWNPTALGTGPDVGAYQFYPYASNSGANSGEATFSNTLPIPYLLRLAPQELPETEAIKLPSGMVVDLTSSRIPSSWGAFEDRNQNGVLDTAAPTEDLNGNGILDDVKFDIPVAPNGTVTGPLTGSGPIYLYLCHRDDVDRLRAMTGYAAGLIPGDFENGTAAPYGPDHPSSERKLVCIIPQTGLVYIAAVNGADANNDGWADDPYSLAREGREDR